MSAFEDNEHYKYTSPKQAPYERDISADIHSEPNLCAIQTRYEHDERSMSANIAQFVHNFSAFHRDECDTVVTPIICGFWEERKIRVKRGDRVK